MESDRLGSNPRVATSCWGGPSKLLQLVDIGFPAPGLTAQHLPEIPHSELVPPLSLVLLQIS